MIFFKQSLIRHSSSGLLIYAALINLLAEDFLSEEAQHLMKKKDQIFALCWIFLGGKHPLHFLFLYIH